MGPQAASLIHLEEKNEPIRGLATDHDLSWTPTWPPLHVSELPTALPICLSKQLRTPAPASSWSSAPNLCKMGCPGPPVRRKKMLVSTGGQWVCTFNGYEDLGPRTEPRTGSRTDPRTGSRMEKLTFRAGFSFVQFWIPKWLGNGNPSDEKN